MIIRNTRNNCVVSDRHIISTSSAANICSLDNQYINIRTVLLRKGRLTARIGGNYPELILPLFPLPRRLNVIAHEQDLQSTAVCAGQSPQGLSHPARCGVVVQWYRVHSDICSSVGSCYDVITANYPANCRLRRHGQLYLITRDQAIVLSAAAAYFSELDYELSCTGSGLNIRPSVQLKANIRLKKATFPELHRYVAYYIECSFTVELT
ncbi:hypothetical protein J6590_055358 [Homalodisca vitripennis]|nr:hypothetical protein J6590_055358 [Homalodisca vitripennis]